MRRFFRSASLREAPVGMTMWVPADASGSGIVLTGIPVPVILRYTGK